MERRFAYFAYGSNMSSSRLRARLPNARALGRARLPGHRLACNKPGRDGSGKANLIPDPAFEAWGVVWEIASDDWALLDRYEPGYARAPCALQSEVGEIVSAALYLAEPRAPRLAPRAWYREHLLLGASEFGLPADWIARIRAL